MRGASRFSIDRLQYLLAASQATLNIFSRDLAFFCVDFFSGDRASDLGRTLTKEVLSLPDGEGLLFKQSIGKTLWGKDCHIFAIKKCPTSLLCPVSNLNRYVQLCKLINVDLTDGYLFRATNKRNRVSENPFIGSAVAARLTSYLEHLGISEGETMHSFRSGCSITLSMLGVPLADIARHVGWKSIQMAQYYSQTDKVLALTKPADALAASTSPCEEGCSSASLLGRSFSSCNNLDGFQMAFLSFSQINCVTFARCTCLCLGFFLSFGEMGLFPSLRSLRLSFFFYLLIRAWQNVSPIS